MQVKFNIGLTDVLAVWGAFIATLVLLWDIYKWKTSGPRIIFKALSNMCIRNVPALPERKTYISLEAVNNGDRPATIRNVGICYYSNCFKKMLRKAKWQALVPFQVIQALPYVLEPGKTWQGVIDQDQLEQEVYDRGILIVKLYLSHSKRPKKVRVRPRKPKDKAEKESSPEKSR